MTVDSYEDGGESLGHSDFFWKDGCLFTKIKHPDGSYTERFYHAGKRGFKDGGRFRANGAPWYNNKTKPWDDTRDYEDANWWECPDMFNQFFVNIEYLRWLGKNEPEKYAAYCKSFPNYP